MRDSAGTAAGLSDWGLGPRGDYGREHGADSDGDAHAKSLLTHQQLIVPVTKGEFDFGPWQPIYYAEFDGKRRKRAIIKVIWERGGTARAGSPSEAWSETFSRLAAEGAS